MAEYTVRGMGYQSRKGNATGAIDIRRTIEDVSGSQILREPSVHLIKFNRREIVRHDSSNQFFDFFHISTNAAEPGQGL